MDLLTVILSVISLPTTIVGLWLLGKKDKAGFLYFSASLSCQLIIFAVQHNYFLVIQMIVLLLFNMRNYTVWKREEKQCLQNQLVQKVK